MARGYGSMERNVNGLFRKYDTSGTTILFILILLGAWPIAILLMIFGLIGSLFSDD